MTEPNALEERRPESHSGIRVQVVRDARELEARTSEWRELAAAAADPNVFYEPWMLLPALRFLHADRDVLFLLMFIPDPDGPAGPPRLCGMFPFERHSRFRGLPCRTLQLLMPLYNRLCTPLVHREVVTECIGALLDWLERSPESRSLVEFQNMAGEGRVAQELHQQVSERQWTVFQSECEIRALFKPMPSAEAYLERALTGKRRKELRRLENRLGELGPTEFRELEPQGDVKPWISAFLDLESRGWKGQEGTSLASQEGTRHFFEASLTEAHRCGQLMMLGLFHQDRPIALKCNFTSGGGSFAFKIAYDEEYARYSPGLLLEMENVRRLHHRPQIAWMDSTAISRHFMINRLWLDRRTIETLLAAPNRAWGNVIVASFPLLRLIKSLARPKGGERIT
jgi:CelD/BcsL family acetyltransferase involved in cellulose biosynthesis